MRQSLLVILTCITFLSNAQTVDNAFGTKGYVISNAKELPGTPTVISTGAVSKRSHVVLADGSVIFGINITTAITFTQESYTGILVGKLKPNGASDSSFGLNGYYFFSQMRSNYLTSLQLEPDGKLLISGISDQGNYPFIMRLQSIGELDSSFGNNGVTLLTSAPYPDLPMVVRRSDNKYWVVYRSPNHIYQFVSYLLNANGVQDATYGMKIHAGLSNVSVHDLSLDAGGKLTVFGTRTENSTTTLVAMKLLHDGSTDAGFGNNGILIYPDLPSKQLLKSLPLANGKSILLLNNYGDSSYLYRVNPNGAFDSSFGTNGRITLKAPSDKPRAFDIYLRSDSVLLVSAWGWNGLTPDKVIAVKQDGRIDSSFGVAGIYNTTSSLYISGNANRTFLWMFTSNSTAVFRALNANGTVDNTYAASGSATVIFTGTKETFGSAGRQSDGKILVAGSIRYHPGFAIDMQGAYIKRYTANGIADPAFGVNGLAENKDMILCGIEDMIVLSDDKILASGGYVIRKFKANGTVDSSFASNGVFNFASFISALSSHNGITRIALQNDGKIVYTGFTYQNGSAEWITGRLNANGTSDAAFGTAGIFRMALATGLREGRTVNITPDQKILISARNLTNYPESTVDIVRLKSNGSLDSTFGTNGKISYSQNTRKLKPNDIIFLADSSFYVLVTSGTSLDLAYGRTYGSSFIMHYSQNGTRDSLYGVNGVANFTGTGYKLSLRPDGRILVASLRSRDPFNLLESQVVQLSRFNKNGQPDSTYGTFGHYLFPRFNYVTADWFANLDELNFNPLPAIMIPYNEDTYITGGTISMRLGDAVLQKFTVTDNFLSDGFALLDTLGATQCNPLRFYWRTNKEHGSQQFTLERSTDGLSYSTLTTLTATGTTTGYTTYTTSYSPPDNSIAYYRVKMTGGSFPAVYSNVITRSASTAPLAPVISITGNVLSSSAASGNQWYNNGIAIAGATGQNYTAVTNGNYTAVVTVSGCASPQSNTINYTATALPELNAAHYIQANPNPVAGILTVTNKEKHICELVLADLNGITLSTRLIKQETTAIDMRFLPSGIYLLRITDLRSKKTFVKKLVKL